jgi:hypothetical protein
VIGAGHRPADFDTKPRDGPVSTTPQESASD